MSLKRGAFIVFEGCDRTGKSTQSKKINEHLNSIGLKSKLMGFPARHTPIGSIINSYLSKNLDLSDESIHLLFSSNRWELSKEIKTSLENGTNLIVDRYSYSGVAFTAAKGLNYEWCKAPEIGLPKPDLVIYLTTDADVLVKRGDFGNERYENVDLQNRVKEFYEKMFKEDSSNLLKINANDTIENVFNIVSSEIVKLIDQIQCKPLNTLW